MSPVKTILTAAWIAPMDNSPIRDGAVVMSQGRIIEVGEIRAMHLSHRDAEVVEAGKSIVLPGLVNPHTHLELSTCRARDWSGGRFIDWIVSLRQRLTSSGEELEETIAAGVTAGLEQCGRFGVTCVGDISQHMHITRPMLRDAPVRGVSFGEVLGMAKLHWRFDELLPRAIDRREESETLRIGLSPHAPYTVDLAGNRKCLNIARQRNLPLATHLAETPDERAFLQHHAGPFREIWDRLGQWEDSIETFTAGGPIDFAHSIGLLDYPTLLAHVNYCDNRELEVLSRGRASVVYCPRTHAYFVHPPHRWRDMLERGINVAVGTDSCASSPDLNPVEELHLLRRMAPQVPAQTLWEMITCRAARAISMEDQIGTLIPGKRADLVVFPAEDEDPLEAILREPRHPTQSWFAGEQRSRQDSNLRPVD